MPVTRKEFLVLSVATAATAAVDPLPALAARPAARPRVAQRTLIHGADLLTMDKARSEAPATDVLIDGGRIVAIGKALAAGDAARVDGSGMVLMPGLVDGYRQVWQALPAGALVHTEPRRFAGYAEFRDRLMVALTPDDHHLAAYAGGLQAIDAGVTTLLDYADIQYDEACALASARGLQQAGVNGWYAYQLSPTPHYRAGDTVARADADAAARAPADDAHFRTLASLRRQVFADETAGLRLGACLAPAMLGAPIDVVGAELARIRATGVGLIAMRCERPPAPFPPGRLGAMDSGIPDLAAADLLGPDLHFVHGNDLTDEELGYLKERGGTLSSAVLEEFVDVMHGHRPPVHGRARKAGVPAGIGSGSIVALPSDYLEHVRAAFSSLELDAEGTAIVRDSTSSDTLDFATRLGAEALRLGDVTGSIAVGKRADLLLVRVDRYGFGSRGSLADRVVNFATQRDIDSVWVGGRLRKAGGRLVGVDTRALRARLRAAQDRVAAAMATVRFT